VSGQVATGTPDDAARHAPLARELSPIEAAFLLLVALLASFSWVAITLAELHLFRPWLLGGVALIVCGAAVMLTWRDTRSGLKLGPGVRPGEGAALAALLALAAVLFFQPGDYLVDGGDASVYLALAESIAKRGGITFVDPLLETIPESARAGLFIQDAIWPHLFNRFSGGIQIADGQPLILPNFFHLFPVLGACITLLFGSGTAIFLNPAAAVMSVWSIWLLGRRLSSPMTGWLAAILLTVNFGEIWFARFASSEMLCQTLVLVGLVCTSIATDDGPSSSGVLAGGAFGLAALTRVDVFFLILPFVLAFLAVAWFVARFRSWRAYLVTLTAVTTQAVVHALTIAQPYTLRIVGEASGWIRGRSALIAAALAVLAGFAWAARRSGIFRGVRWRSVSLQSLATAALCAAIVLVGLTAPGRLGDLISPLGVFAAFAGLGLMLTSDASMRRLPVVTIFLGSCFIYLARLNLGRMPFRLRRFVPVILPLALLLAAHFVWRLTSDRRPIARAAAAIPVLLAALFIWTSWPVILRPPMQGVRPQLEQLASHFPEDSLVLFDRPVLSHVALALNYTFDRDALVVRELDHLGQALPVLLERSLARGRRVFAVTDADTSGADALRRSDLQAFDMRPVGAQVLQLLILEETRVEFPRKVVEENRRVEIYEIFSPLDRVDRARPPVEIDIGELDFSAILRGFHGSELMPSATARWTEEQAEVALPAIDIDARSPAALVVRMAASRPSGFPAPRSTFSIATQTVGRVPGVAPGFSEYRFALSDDALEQLRAGTSALKVVSDSFVPKAVGAGEDQRRLGVAIDWIRIESAGR
jgi:hypothetical protein